MTDFYYIKDKYLNEWFQFSANYEDIEEIKVMNVLMINLANGISLEEFLGMVNNLNYSNKKKEQIIRLIIHFCSNSNELEEYWNLIHFDRHLLEDNNNEIKTILNITDNMLLVNSAVYTEWVNYLNANIDDELSYAFIQELLTSLMLLEIDTPDKIMAFCQKEGLSEGVIVVLMDLLSYYAIKGEELRTYWNNKYPNKAINRVRKGK